MSYLFIATLRDRAAAEPLLAALERLGIARERVQVRASGHSEHGSDPYSRWNLLGGLGGGVVGAVLGWLVLSATAMAPVGALWGAVVGSICGARYFGYLAPAAPATAIPPDGAVLEIEVADQRLAAAVQQLCPDATCIPAPAATSAST